VVGVSVKVIADAAHTAVRPVIGAGEGLTTTVVSVVQPVLKV
jgi:hypothetical protein